MKKILSILAVIVLTFTLVACGDTSDKGTLTWNGLGEEAVSRGDRVDLLSYVTVTDSIDGDISDKVIVLDDGGFTSELAAGYTVVYEVENSTGVKERKNKDFVVRIEANVANGDFSAGPNRPIWKLDTPGGNATIKYEDGKAKIAITNSGNSWWGIQLYQTNSKFEANTTYKLSLKASSSEGQSIAAGFEDVDGNSEMMPLGFMPLKLNEVEQTYEMYYTPESNIANVKVVVYLGHMLPTDDVPTGETHTVILDDIYVEKVTLNDSVSFSGTSRAIAYSGGEEFDPLAGISASQGSNDLTAEIKVLGNLPNTIKVESEYFLTYFIKFEDGSIAYVNRIIGYKINREFEWKAINGSFTEGLLGWTQDVNNQFTGKATFSQDLDEGTVAINVENPSSGDYHIQLQQRNIILREGKEYKIVLRIKSDFARQINVEVSDNDAGNAPIASTEVNNLLRGIDIGPEWKTVEVVFTANKDYTDVKLGLLLGKVGSTGNNITVYVDQLDIFQNQNGTWK